MAISTHEVCTDDGKRLRLTRMHGGDRGPVLLVHGAAVQAEMFALPTLKTNFAEYLMQHSYDVWLLDWRASIALGPSHFTLDDAAENDMPAAVDAILALTGRDSLEAVVHCAGATTFLMSMADGLLPAVRRVAVSQVGLHPNAPLMTDVKAKINLGGMLQALGVEYMTPDDDDGQKLLQLLLTAVSSVHLECASTFCHRLTFIYGHLYQHAQLNVETHDRLDEQFGRCSVLALRHITQMVKAGTASKFNYGKVENKRRYGTAKPPSYLNPDHFKLPITFLSGELNRTYLPDSTQRTYDWLVASNGQNGYTREVLPGYGHLDTFMGSNAAVDTYPRIVAALD